MHAVIHGTSAAIEVVVDGAPMLQLRLVAHDHCDEQERTRVTALLEVRDVIALHALLGVHLRTQGVQS